MEPIRPEALSDGEDSHDGVTGVYTRSSLLSLLFRETDRVQRMHIPLCFVLFAVDARGQASPPRDDLLREIVKRATPLMRSYDLLGRVGPGSFLMALPGCRLPDAASFAQRLNQAVISADFRDVSERIRLTACFGVVSSEGRSPVVVLRHAESALEAARRNGPGTVHIADPFENLKTPGTDEVNALAK